MILQVYLSYEPLRREPFDAMVVEYLEERDEPNATLLTPSYMPYPQARTNHPVIVHWQTAGYITYMPQLGPALQKMYGDLYGIPFGVSEHDGHENQPQTWQPLWRDRTYEEWQALAKEYDFDYVWAPEWMNLDLPRVVNDDTWALYTTSRE